MEPEPLSAEQAISQLTSERIKQQRLAKARASGARTLSYGLLVSMGTAVAAYFAPDTMWLVVVALGVVGGSLVLAGALRPLAAQALARR